MIAINTRVNLSSGINRISAITLFIIIFALVGLNLGIYGFDVASSIQSYRIGDWLINYQDGFVRRGLIGQIIYRMSADGLSTIWLTYAIQCAIYILLSYYVLRLYYSTQRSKAWLLIIFSPAFIFLFPFYDPSGWYRKELLVYLPLVLLLFGLRAGVLRITYIWVALIVYILAVFSHEVASLTLIFFLYPLYSLSQQESRKESKQGSKHQQLLYLLMMAFSAVAIVGFIFSVAYPGGASAVDQICRSLSLREIDPAICGGAIQYLSLDMHHGLREVWDKIQTRQYLPIYVFLMLLSFVPILLSSWWKKRIVFLILGFIFLAPLFFIGMDWGRWVAIYASLIYLIVLFDSTLAPIPMRPVSWMAVILYSALWSIPHIQGAPTRLIQVYAGSGPGLGLLDLGFVNLPQAISQSPLRHSIWMDLQKYYEGLIVYPLKENSTEQDIFYYFAKMNLISSNVEKVGHLNQAWVQKENRINHLALETGQYLQQSFYILDQASALLVWRHIHPTKDALLKIDGFYVLAPNWKILANDTLNKNYAGITQFAPLFGLDQMIYFSDQNKNSAPFLFEGWSTPENWGIWSNGSTAIMKLPLPRATAKELVISMKAFVSKNHPQQQVSIFMNDMLTKKLTLNADKYQLVELDIPRSVAEQGLLTLRFEMNHPISPEELGISQDKRKLGIGISSVVYK